MIEIMKATKINKKLDEIAEKLKNGKKYEELSTEVDFVLGTIMLERDLEAEEIFEHSKEE